MARQDGEVDRAHQSGSLKTRGAVVEVVSEIRREKQDRDYERRDLAGAMSHDVSRADKSVSGEQQQSARSVKTSIEMREI